MKFIVEVDEFWLDEESDLEPSLRGFVIKEVTAKINKQIEKKVDETITRQVKEQIQKQLLAKTNKLIDEFIEKGKMTTGYSSDPDVSVGEYIRRVFNNKNGWGNPKDQIEKLAKQFGTELKNRYDLLFATQIVKSLDKEGLLKENIAKMILENN